MVQYLKFPRIVHQVSWFQLELRGIRYVVCCNFIDDTGTVPEIPSYRVAVSIRVTSVVLCRGIGYRHHIRGGTVPAQRSGWLRGMAENKGDLVGSICYSGNKTRRPSTRRQIETRDGRHIMIILCTARVVFLALKVIFLR